MRWIRIKGMTGIPPTSDAEPTTALDQRIGRAVTRLEKAVDRRPDFGRTTSTTTTNLIDGLRCVSLDGDHCIKSDLTPALGGEGAGPSPSAVLRAALGSCLAMGYRLQAARRGFPVESIRVTVETDSALGGMLDPSSPFPPGFTEVRYDVRIESPESAAACERLIDTGDRLSPVLDTIARANRVLRLHPSQSMASIGGEG